VVVLAGTDKPVGIVLTFDGLSTTSTASSGDAIVAKSKFPSEVIVSGCAIVAITSAVPLASFCCAKAVPEIRASRIKVIFFILIVFILIWVQMFNTANMGVNPYTNETYSIIKIKYSLKCTFR
jgi:hypothetical protein